MWENARILSHSVFHAWKFLSHRTFGSFGPEAEPSCLLYTYLVTGTHHWAYQIKSLSKKDWVTVSVTWFRYSGIAHVSKSSSPEFESTIHLHTHARKKCAVFQGRKKQQKSSERARGAHCAVHSIRRPPVLDNIDDKLRTEEEPGYRTGQDASKKKIPIQDQDPRTTTRIQTQHRLNGAGAPPPHPSLLNHIQKHPFRESVCWSVRFL